MLCLCRRYRRLLSIHAFSRRPAGDHHRGVFNVHGSARGPGGNRMSKEVGIAQDIKRRQYQFGASGPGGDRDVGSDAGRFTKRQSQRFGHLLAFFASPRDSAADQRAKRSPRSCRCERQTGAGGNGFGWPACLSHCVLMPGALAFDSRDAFGAFLPLISLMGSIGSLYSIIAALRSSCRKRLPCASNFSLNSLF